MKNPHYVIAIDPFMSGWGHAAGLKNILVFECESIEEAKIVANNARRRKDMQGINIYDCLPPVCLTNNGKEYENAGYFVQHKTIKDYPKWYQKNAW